MFSEPLIFTTSFYDKFLFLSLLLWEITSHLHFDFVFFSFRNFDDHAHGRQLLDDYSYAKIN